MAVFGPGDFFGEIALLDGTVRIGSIRARTVVEVLVMGKEIFSQISGSLTPFRNLLAQALRWRRPRLDPRLRQAWAGLERRPLSTFIESASDHRLSPHGTFEEAVRLFDRQAVEFLCVLDADERLQGIITRSELFEAFAQGKTPATQARDFMRTDPLAVTPQDTSLIVGALMNKHDIDWLPVVADKESRRLIGIIRSERMLRYLMASPSE
jgi:NADH dehydrogenase